MNKMKSAWTFGGGLMLGVALTFCLGADTAKDPKDLKKDWAQHLQLRHLYGRGDGDF